MGRKRKVETNFDEITFDEILEARRSQKKRDEIYNRFFIKGNKDVIKLWLYKLNIKIQDIDDVYGELCLIFMQQLMHGYKYSKVPFVPYVINIFKMRIVTYFQQMKRRSNISYCDFNAVTSCNDNEALLADRCSFIDKYSLNMNAGLSEYSEFELKHDMSMLIYRDDVDMDTQAVFKLWIMEDMKSGNVMKTLDIKNRQTFNIRQRKIKKILTKNNIIKYEKKRT